MKCKTALGFRYYRVRVLYTIPRVLYRSVWWKHGLIYWSGSIVPLPDCPVRFGYFSSAPCLPDLAVLCFELCFWTLDSPACPLVTFVCLLTDLCVVLSCSCLPFWPLLHRNRQMKSALPCVFLVELSHHSSCCYTFYLIKNNWIQQTSLR